MLLKLDPDTGMINRDSRARRSGVLALLVAVIAAGFYLLLASAPGPTPVSAGVARADVIDEYEEPPPPTPQPEPQPSPGGSGGGGSKPSSGGSSSDSGASYSYSTDSSTSATGSDSSGKKKKESSKPKPVTPQADRPATVALQESSNDSFFAAAFGGVGWGLPALMIAFAIGAAIYLRFGNPARGRARQPDPRTSRLGS